MKLSSIDRGTERNGRHTINITRHKVAGIYSINEAAASLFESARKFRSTILGRKPMFVSRVCYESQYKTGSELYPATIVAAMDSSSGM